MLRNRILTFVAAFFVGYVSCTIVGMLEKETDSLAHSFIKDFERVEIMKPLSKSEFQIVHDTNRLNVHHYTYYKNNEIAFRSGVPDQPSNLDDCYTILRLGGNDNYFLIYCVN